MAEEDPWLGLTEAAQRSGLAREAIRARARRGQITSRKANRGELLVQLPADGATDLKISARYGCLIWWSRMHDHHLHQL